jgi:YegS/Rv2252/BmrU family lipid kinase
MRIAFIANPHAGRGRTEAFLSRHERTFGHEAEVLWTEAPRHATELARAARDRCDVVCAIGGDGTVHEVVNGLMPDPVPLVIIPAGSGNDFAGMFGCPRTPEELADVLAHGAGVMLDVLDCTERYCANSTGIGLEALVTKKSLSIRRLRGLPLYFTAAVRALASFDCPPMTLTLGDGETIVGERLLVSVANGVSAGGGFRLTPDSFPDDGELDLCIVERMPRARIVRLLPRAIGGSHTRAKGVMMRRTSEVTVESERPFHCHVDGEYLGEQPGPMHFRVIPRCLPLLCRGEVPTRTKHPPMKIL